MVRAAQKEKGVDYLNCVFIVDLDGMTLFSHMTKRALDFFRSSSQESYFNGYSGKFFVVNIPFIFKSIWVGILLYIL